MQFNPSIPDFWLIIFVLLILIILGFQLYVIINSQSSGKKKWIKSVLNLLVGFSFILYLFQPSWNSSIGSDPVLVYSKDISGDRLNFLKDSLGIRRDLEIEKYNGFGNPVFLVGQNYSEIELNRLSGKSVNWIKNSENSELTFLNWKGIVRNGEMQQLIGELQVDQPSLLELKFQNQLIRSDSIDTGQNRFEFNFPVNVSGRNELGLFLNDSLLGEIRFFSSESKPKSYSLRFSFPDPEVRVLTQYLLKKGEKVEEEIQVSKSSVIRSEPEELDSIKVLIGDLAQLKPKSVKQELNSGLVGVLMINSQNPELDSKELNDLFSTSFEINRNSSDEYRVLESGIEVLPYSFVPKAGQKLILENSIAIENLGGLKVGMSLISQTFPRYLSGDTLAYERIWDEILGEIIPDELENWKYEAPVFSNRVSKIRYNGINSEAVTLQIEEDTIYLQQDLVNPFTKTGNFSSQAAEWMTLADSMEVYIYGEDELKSIRTELNLSNFLKYENSDQSKTEFAMERVKISDWIWLSFFLILFGLLWLEPRLNY